jgi:hypothetical protein
VPYRGGRIPPLAGLGAALAGLGIGPIAVGIASALFPTAIATGVPTQAQVDAELGSRMLGLPEARPYLGEIPHGLYPRLEVATVEPTPFGRRVMDAVRSGAIYDEGWLRDQLFGGQVGPATPTQVQRSVTQGPPQSLPALTPPAPAVVSAPTPRTGPLGRLNPKTLQMATLAGLGVGLLQKRRSRSAQGTTLTPTPTPAIPGTAPLPGLNLTGFQYAGVPSSSTDGTCQCEKRKRGRMRECKERATVKWKTGRRRGQDAGSKCVVYYA